jgi:hypothetical protein
MHKEKEMIMRQLITWKQREKHKREPMKLKKYLQQENLV